MMTYLIYYPIFWIGYLIFKITNKTFWYPYVSFRRLFVITRGRINDFISSGLKISNPPYSIEKHNGVLGNLSSSEIKNIIDEIKRDGCYIFNTKLSDEKIQALIQFANITEADLVPPSKDGLSRAIYNRNKLLSPRYQFKETDVLNNNIIQEILIDSTLLAVAQGYLGCKPIQDLIAMWWSVPFSKEASSEAAQLFHFDMDRFKFIKFFFYLTDVDSQNGPHCFVKGTHRYLPDNLWKDGRIQDKEIFNNFSKEEILEITGSKGTIIAVDTRGLHKGKLLEKGERLLLQFEFTNSLFGVKYNKIDLRGINNHNLKSVFKKYSYTYQRFNI